MQNTSDNTQAPIQTKRFRRDDGLGRLRAACGVYYDLQRLRIATANRGRPKTENESAPALTPADQGFFDASAKGILGLEKDAVKHIEECIEGIPIWEDYLTHIRGLGPVMGAVLITGFDIHSSDKPSSYWQHAGLGMVQGPNGYQIQKRQRGVKANYNPELKTRLLGVLSSVLMKAYSLDEKGYFYWTGQTCKQKKLTPDEFCPVCRPIWEKEQAAKAAEAAALAAGEKPKAKAKKKAAPKKAKKGAKAAEVEEPIEEPTEEEGKPICVHRIKIRVDPRKTPVWRKVADDRRHRRQNQLVAVCMCCNGTGRAKSETKEGEEAKFVKCWNCDGTGGPAPWGHSEAHRMRDALRYMVKMFILDFIKYWKGLEGLPLRPPYEEEKLGIPHSVAMPLPRPEK